MSDQKKECYYECCTAQKEVYEGRHDSDLCAALLYNGQPNFCCADIVDILASVPGEHDGNNWHWVVKLRSGEVFLVEAGCDYTGWDCQSHADSQEYATPNKAASAAKDDSDRQGLAQQLLRQLDGAQPFGTWIS